MTTRVASLLARAAIVVAVAAAAPSCLVTSTQSFDNPTQTAPFLSAVDAVPSLTQVILVPNGKGPITFQSRVQSEDGNVDLTAVLIADDIDAPLSPVLDRQTIPADHLNNVGRAVTLTWDPRVPPRRGRPLGKGCHSLTMLVTHQFNDYDVRPKSHDDSDLLVWWLIIGDPADPTFIDSVKASGCPAVKR